MQIATRKGLNLALQEDVVKRNFFLEGKISLWLAKNDVHEISRIYMPVLFTGEF